MIARSAIACHALAGALGLPLSVLAQTPPKPPAPLDDLIQKGYRHSEPVEQAPAALKGRADLGPIDRWRFDRCNEAATDKSTAAGVQIAQRHCTERFLSR